MPHRKVVNLGEWRDKDTAKIIAYLMKRLEAGDLGGLVVQSIDKKGNERVHTTGVYSTDRKKAVAAALALSIRMTASAGGFEDSELEE